MRFASFFSGGFITVIVINPPEKNWQNAPLCTGLIKTKARKLIYLVAYSKLAFSKKSNEIIIRSNESPLYFEHLH